MPEINIKIWEIGTGGTDWIAAQTKEEAIICFGEEMGYTFDESGESESFNEDYPDIDEDVTELREDLYEAFTFVRDECSSHYSEGKVNFRERLNQMIEDGDEFPAFFASTEA